MIYLKNMLEKIRKLANSKKILHPYDKFCRLFFPIIPFKLKPNHLTIARIIGTPFMIILLWLDHYLWGLFLFIILALTDMFDGALARDRNQITYTGILLDPIADKLLVGSAAVVLLVKVNLLLALIVVGLEVLFLLGGLIKTTKKKAVDLEANLWGKVKMNVQVIAAVLLFIGLVLNNPIMISTSEIIFWFSAFLAVGNFFSRVIK